MLAFVPSATQIQQPCDVAAFHLLKDDYTAAIRMWKEDHDECSLTKKDFPSVFKKAFDFLKKSTIQNRFRTCGLYPFDQNVIDYTKLLKKKHWVECDKSIDTDSKSLTSKSSLQSFLTFFEQRINPRKLHAFKSSYGAINSDTLLSFFSFQNN